MVTKWSRIFSSIYIFIEIHIKNKWDLVNTECTLITQTRYSVIYYQLIFSRLEGKENPVRVEQAWIDYLDNQVYNRLIHE